MDNRIYGSWDVAGTVHDNRNIAGAYADGRFPGGVCRFYHSGTACSQDNIHGFHQFIGKLNGRFLDPSDNAFRCPCFYSGIQYDLGCFDGTLLGSGMGTDDDGVSGFQTDQTFENSCRCGVRGGNDRTYDANRFSNFFNAV